MRDLNTALALLLAAMVAVPATVAAQTSPSHAQPQRSPVRDAYQGGWQPAAERAKDKSNADDAALDLMSPDVDSGALSLDLFRAQRNAALARKEGRLGPAEQAQLREQAVTINSMRPNSFEGRMASYYAEFPAPAAWPELEAAARLQPERLELVGPLLTKALREGDRARLVPAAKDLKARGEVAPALYHIADDLLLSIDRDGVLIVAGEMDGFPVLVRQFAEGKRPDALVIDQRLLDDAAYRATAWRQAGANGAVPASASAFVEQLHARTSRPVFLSLALGRAVAAAHADKLHVTGLAMRMSAEACCPMAALDAAWKKMRKTTEAGPLSRNYLVPAAVLLNHSRAAGDERRASELEHELRQLASKLGATRELQANGILPH